MKASVVLALLLVFSASDFSSVNGLTDADFLSFMEKLYPVNKPKPSIPVILLTEPPTTESTTTITTTSTPETTPTSNSKPSTTDQLTEELRQEVLNTVLKINEILLRLPSVALKIISDKHENDQLQRSGFIKVEPYVNWTLHHY